MSRRLRSYSTIFVAALVVTSLATANIGLSAQPTTTDTSVDTFHVTQNGTCYEVSPIGSGDQTVSEFYDYRTPNTTPSASTWSSHGTTEYQDNQVSNILIYNGSEGYSLVMLHDELGDAPHGSTITFDITGLPSDRTWAVEDDDYEGRDDNFIHDETSSLIDWKWAPNRTDGAAVRGLASNDYEGITIEPRFNEDARAWGDWTWSGDEQNKTETWRLWVADRTVTELDMDQSVTIYKGGCPDTTADFSVAPKNPTTDDEIEFDGSDSSTNDEIVSYEWSFDDETTKTGQSVTHSFAESGDHTVTLTVTDSEGNTDTTSKTITVEEPNQAPSADAGADQTVAEETDVTLDGSDSSDPDGDSLTYSWKQIDGPKVTLSGADTPTPSFTAPSVSETTTLTFELTVDDGNDATATNTVTVTVEPNNPPTADAGDNQTVDEETSVTLDASSSSDPDGDALTYSWTQTSGPDVSLAGADTAAPSFTAPSVSETTTLTFEVTVEDEHGATDTDTVTITVEPTTTTQPNNPPTADAGADQTVDEETSVTLDASGSSDPDGDSLSYSWAQTDGPDVSLSDTSSETPEFTAPSVDSTTTLTFEVTVEDEHGATDTDTVTITVEPVNEAPSADAGDDRTVNEETSVSLDASSSSDPDGDALTYSWTQTSGPDVSLAGADTATPSFTAPSVSAITTLTFEVTVTDEHGATASDTVTVTVEPVEDGSDDNADRRAELVDRIKEIAADGDITREELESLVGDVTREVVRMVKAITNDGPISESEVERIADAILEEQE